MKKNAQSLCLFSGSLLTHFRCRFHFSPKFFQLANLCGVHESYGLMQETAYERCFWIKIV